MGLTSRFGVPNVCAMAGGKVTKHPVQFVWNRIEAQPYNHHQRFIFKGWGFKPNVFGKLKGISKANGAGNSRVGTAKLLNALLNSPISVAWRTQD